FIAEIATKEFMEDLKSLVISNPQANVRTKILELIQCWTSAFKGISEYKIVEDTHSLLKMNGFEFPPIDEAKAMFLAESAPDWAEGDNCYRCRVEFGVFTRKHHCRACGQIFCDKCSNKQMLLPQFGIEKKVRVCEACFDKKTVQQQPKAEINKAAEEAAAREKALKEAEAKEQEELELALAISQSEAEAKQKYNGIDLSYINKATNDNSISSGYGGQKFEPPPQTFPVIGKDESNLSGMVNDDANKDDPIDSVLATYLDRDYWERKRREVEEQPLRATAPPPSEISISISSSISQQQPLQQNGNANKSLTKTPTNISNVNNNTNNNYPLNEPLDFSILEDQQQQQISQHDNSLSQNYAAKLNIGMPMDIGKNESNDGGVEEVAETLNFCNALNERVDTMKTRMRSNQLRGRSIVNDSAIHTLFSQLTELHAIVIQKMTKLEEQREHYEQLQDHLAHIQEARQAVNALREENERLRQERIKEENNRRKSQLRQTLEVMRDKKKEMLVSGRYVAIQRFHEQEWQIRQQRLSSPQFNNPALPTMTNQVPPLANNPVPINMMNNNNNPVTSTQQQMIHNPMQSMTNTSTIPPIMMNNQMTTMTAGVQQPQIMPHQPTAYSISQPQALPAHSMMMYSSSNQAQQEMHGQAVGYPGNPTQIQHQPQGGMPMMGNNPMVNNHQSMTIPMNSMMNTMPSMTTTMPLMNNNMMNNMPPINNHPPQQQFQMPPYHQQQQHYIMPPITSTQQHPVNPQQQQNSTVQEEEQHKKEIQVPEDWLISFD
uniref:Hepatocyte growth factor-regulated tyrosine kinase substrate n=1 Tax=Meloidogyne incognita TaxID=6306 RepID=A0A914KYJ6_MELIC